MTSLYPSVRSRSWLNRSFQIVLLAAIFLVLWQVANGEQAVQLLLQADLAMLGAALFLLSLQTILSALRWKITASQLGIKMNSNKALREYYIAQAANQSLPGGVLGDLARAARSSQQAGWLRAAQAVVIERLIGQLGLLIVFFSALVISLVSLSEFEIPIWLLLASSMALLLSALVLATLVSIARLSNSGFSRFLTGIWINLQAAIFDKKVFWMQLLLSLGTAILNVYAFVLSAWAIGAEIDLIASFIVIPIVLLAMLVPLTIGGWGVREALAATLFPLAAAGATQGLAASVAFGLVFILASAPGFFAVLFMGRSREYSGKEFGV